MKQEDKTKEEIIEENKLLQKCIVELETVDTERKKTESELKRCHRRMERIINSIADPIFVKDRKHAWILLNDSFCNFVGRKREELLGKSDYDFFSKEEADIFWQKDEVVFVNHEENVNEEKFTDANGIVHVLLTRKVAYIDESGEEILVGTIQDITDHKKAEEELRVKLDELERFHKATIEREFRIKELNDEIKRLKLEKKTG